jgi:cytochrome c oxidase assembly protein Cox11
MKKAIAAVVLIFAVGQAVASCPIYQPYRCVSGFNGKMICGCGV